MKDSLAVAAFLEGWLQASEHRLGNRFEVFRFGEWDVSVPWGIGFDLIGEFAMGRVTAWSQRDNAEWPFADVEVLDYSNGDVISASHVQPLTPELLDSWLAQLEAHKISS